MKATFAFLSDSNIHNLVRKLSWDIHQKYRTGVDVCRLPPHISIKQPFEISDLLLLEKYMTEIAGGIEPFEVKLKKLELIPATIDGLDTGILWLDVEESELLRQTHNRVNQELALRIGNVSAPFDGVDYHFHMTIAIGGQPIDVYRKIWNEFSEQLVNLIYTVREMCMFVYDDMEAVNAGYMTCMIMPLGRNSVLDKLPT
ncbi:MAG TPA: 2'-5' RNA ligase family protein [Anaerolineales bacterium]|nr:2'-5' RNA ligase family protein [Anaerolineales bacterium]